ncbi:MAG: histidine phosphatase family protein [Deltaproteobacteria bacterium]|nr:histidine phosphatase family protein [Deltaproteobacteria bacterium]
MFSYYDQLMVAIVSNTAGIDPRASFNSMIGDVTPSLQDGSSFIAAQRTLPVSPVTDRLRIPRLFDTAPSCVYRQLPVHGATTSDTGTGTPPLPRPLYANFNSFIKDAAEKKWSERGTLLVLSRHGTSLFNRVKDINGTNNSPLIKDGETEAGQLAETLSPLEIDMIYASPLERARRSAEMIAETLGPDLPVFYNADLEEFERGILAGRPKNMSSREIDVFFAKFKDPDFRDTFQKKYALTTAEVHIVLTEMLHHRRQLQAYAHQAGLTEDQFVDQVLQCEQQMDCRPPLGESWRDGITQAKKFVSSKIDRHTSGSILIVGHSMSLSSMVWTLLGYDINSIKQLDAIKQAPAGVTVVWKDPSTKKWELLVLNSSCLGE